MRSLVLAIALVSAPAEAACLSYAGPAEISGTLIARTVPGPPNYESVRKGDRAERIWLVRLDHPACVDADPKGDGINEAADDLREIQLVLGKEAYDRYRDLLNRHVAARGTLIGAHTGHHRTPVLIEIATMSRRK
jgi:hypothetical protein